MSYAEKNLVRDEKIIKVGRLSWACVLVGLIWFPPVLAFLARLISRASTEISLTTTRVVGKEGIIKSGSIDLKLEKIQSVSVRSGLFGKIFGYGTIIVSTAGSVDGQFKFKNIGGAEALKRMIMEQVENAQEEKQKRQAMEMARAMREFK